MSDAVETNLRVAERIVGLLTDFGVPVVVIGAVALAAHRYVRFTEDLDLGVNASGEKMEELVTKLRSEGYEVEFEKADSDDPLGGVINVFGSFGLVQVINFEGRFPAVIRDALCGEEIRMRSGSLLRIAPIPQLVALKLYSGGLKSRSDVLELLRRNPQVDLDDLRETCRGYRLGGLEQILEEMGEGD